MVVSVPKDITREASMTRIRYLLLALLFLSGCVATYTHPKKSLADFDTDRKYCQAKAQHMATLKARQGESCIPCDEVKKCLERDKGWVRVR
jgi:hypothetical protein